MSERKERFTPRPWVMTPNRVNCGGTIMEIDGGEDGDYVALIGMPMECEVGRANAALLLAAPEMYNAEKDKIVHLQTLKNQIMSLLGMVKPIPLVTPEFTLNYIDQIIEETEKLLAMARGEQKHDQH